MGRKEWRCLHSVYVQLMGSPTILPPSTSLYAIFLCPLDVAYIVDNLFVDHAFPISNPWSIRYISFAWAILSEEILDKI